MNKSILILGIGCAGLASASGYLWQEMHAQRARADSLQSQITQLRSVQKLRPATTYAPPATESTPTTAASSAVSEVPVTPARITSIQSAPNANGTARARFMGGFEQQQRLLKDPEYRKLMLAQQRMAMARMHPDLMSALGLSREQTGHLFDLLAEQQMRSMEHQPRMRGMNGPPDEATVQQMQREAQEEQQSREADVAALLGDEKLAEWKEYQESMGARFQVNQLRDTLASSDSALRQDQIQPLVAVIAQEQRRVMTDSAYNTPRPMHASMQASMQAMTAENRTRAMEEMVERTRASNQRVHDAATAILSPDQLDSLDQMLNQNLDMQRMSVRMMRARAEAEARGEAPPEAAIGMSTGFVTVGPQSR